MKTYDVIIIGGGASGLSAARAAAARNRKCAVLDMGNAPARKVMLSGGGRCNFTNMAATWERYYGRNPKFVRGALARITPRDILNWAAGHNIKWVEKSAGQYFCATGAADIVNALVRDAAPAHIYPDTVVRDVEKRGDKFIIKCDGGEFCAESVIVATGGITFAAAGVSNIGHLIAKKFGHKIIPVRPALCAIKTNAFSSDLAGISTDVEITIGRDRIHDAMLFTHFGIGGPAIYRATLHDLSGGMHINLMPGVDAFDWLRDMRQAAGRKFLQTIIATHMPMRIAKWIEPAQKNIADYSNAELKSIATKISDIFIPASQMEYHGMASAEVTHGGISTDAVSSKTMESALCPGLYFAGEVLDIAGDLGGFNLQWAFSSGIVAGQNA